MADITGGTVTWNFDVDTSQFDTGLARASTEAKAFSSGLDNVGRTTFKSFANNAASSFNSISSGLGHILLGVGVFAASSAIGFGAAAKAAFGQVDAVQQATVALKAYEKNGDAVNQVLKDLITYARSDLGVLFQRQDLFQAAQSLKLYGDETGALVDHVKILSRSVGLGLSDWNTLNTVVGRVGSTGRLVGDDFDNLTKAGFKLDPALRNTNITFDSLFKALDKGIPTDAMEGQSKTIKGQMVRLQTAFRDVGSAILGVDKDTSTFIKGGLGDTLVKSIDTLRVSLKDPAFLAAIQNLGKSLGEFAKKVVPLLIAGFKWLANNAGTVADAMIAITVAFVAAKIAAVAFQIASAGTFGLIAAVVVALVAIITFLQLKFNIFGKAADAVVTAWQAVDSFFKNMWRDILNIFGGIGKWFADRFTEAKDGVVKAFDAVVGGVQKVIDKITGFVQDHIQVIKDWAIVITTILLPKIVAIGVQAAITAGKTIASFVSMSASAVAEATVTSAAWVASAATSSFAWVTTELPKIIAGFVLMAVKAGVQATITTAAFVASSIKTLIAWGITFAGYLIGIGLMVAQTAIAALAMAASWLLAMGPIGAIVAVVIGLTALIIANWETVKGWFLAFWNWLQGAATAAWDWVGGVITGLVNGIKSTASAVWNAIKFVADKIGGFFSGAASWLFETGKAIVQGLVDGIKSMVKAVGDAAGNIGSAVKDKVKNLLGIHSPSKVFAGYGENVVQGFVKGIEGGKNALNTAMGQFSADISSNPLTTTIKTDEIKGTPSTPSTVNQPVVVNLHMSGIMTRSRSDMRDITKDMLESVNEELRAKGVDQIGGGVLVGGTTNA